MFEFCVYLCLKNVVLECKWFLGRIKCSIYYQVYLINVLFLILVLSISYSWVMIQRSKFGNILIQSVLLKTFELCGGPAIETLLLVC